jgi:flavin-dependent thymidylate synthase
MEPDGTFDELIYDHKYVPYVGNAANYCGFDGSGEGGCCGMPSAMHADPSAGQAQHLIQTTPHPYQARSSGDDGHCTFYVVGGGDMVVCGYPEKEHERKRSTSSVVRMADVAQYARPPMPDEARGKIAVTLIDAPVDPLGTLAVLCGIYEGRVARSKAEVTDDARRAAWEAMQATVLSGPLEAMQFTFLVEGVTRSITHQMVRNRFAFFAQESLRFAVADDWAQEVPLPPSLAGLADDDPRVTIWRRQMNATEDAYGALVGAGMPAEEARGVLPHDIPTRLYVTWSMRSLLQEAGKRTCTQAQFPWRTIFGGIAAAFRGRAKGAGVYYPNSDSTPGNGDGWQYRMFAEAIRPVCYQTGSCGFMAKFDRGCTIRSRVDANERLGRPSSEWHTEYDVVSPEEIVVGVGPKSVVVDRDGTTPLFIGAINPAEWAADPGAARVHDA